MATIERVMRAAEASGYVEMATPPRADVPTGWRVFERRHGTPEKPWSVYLLLSSSGGVFYSPSTRLADAAPLGHAATEAWVNKILREAGVA